MQTKLVKIPILGMDARLLDRQSPPGLCEDIVNLRPDGPKESPYWVPVPGSVSANDIGIGAYFGYASALIKITTLPRRSVATLRVTYNSVQYSAPYNGTLGTPQQLLLITINAIAISNDLPFRVTLKAGDLYLVATTPGSSINGKTVVISGSTGGTFTTGVFTGGVAPSDLPNVPGAFQSKAAFYFEKKDGTRQVLSLDTGGLRIYDLTPEDMEVNAKVVDSGYVSTCATIMSATQLDDIIAVGLSEDDVPKSLTYLYDGIPLDMDPPVLPSVKCSVVRLDPTRYKTGLEPGWYGVRVGWRLTDGRVINLSIPSIIQIRKEYVGGSSEKDEDPKYYAYHLEFEVEGQPELKDWNNLISGIAVFITPRADTSLVDEYDANGNSNVGGNSGYTDIVGAKITYYGKTAYTLVSRSTEVGYDVTFKTVQVNREGDTVFPYNTPGSDLGEFLTIVEDAIGKKITINIPVAARYATAGFNSYPEPFTIDARSVFNAIRSDSTLITALIGERVSPDSDKYVIELITGTNPGWHPPGQMANQSFTVKVPKAAGVDDGDPIDEGDYQSRLAGKEHSVASSFYYDIGSIPMQTGSLSFKETEEILLTYPISQEDNVVNQHKVKAAIVTSYNKQLILGNTSIDFATPRPNPITIAFEGGAEGPEEGTVEVSMMVKIVANGKDYYRQGESVSMVTYAGKVRDSIIAYPDRRATEMAVTIGGSTRRLSLTASKRNNFAYAVVRGLDLADQGKIGGFGTVSTTDDDHAPNRVMVSEPFNPHIFLAKRVIYGDNQFYDAIRGFGVNAMPMASGQFGTYPMYVLCKNSVWALEQGADPDVAFARKAPVSVSHGLSHPYAVCNIGQVIAFASNNGVHFISGGKMDHVSDPVDNYLLASPERIRLGYYDRDQRRELWCATEGSVYVWSFEYRLWYRLDRNRIHFFSDGRTLMSVDDRGAIIDESKGATTALPWKIKTRPLHWGEPNLMKRLFRMALRHSFATEPAKTILPDNNLNPIYEGDSPGYFAIKYGSVQSVTIQAQGLGDDKDYLHTIDIEYEPRYTHRYRS